MGWDAEREDVQRGLEEERQRDAALPLAGRVTSTFGKILAPESTVSLFLNALDNNRDESILGGLPPVLSETVTWSPSEPSGPK